MNILKIVSAFLITVASSSAFADCTIKLTSCKKMGINSATAFADSYNGADKNPAACLQRARDYFNSCSAKQEVGAEFSINGTLTISAYVTQNGSNLWTKSANGLWIYIPSKY